MPLLHPYRHILLRSLLALAVLLTLGAGQTMAQDTATPVAIDQLDAVQPEWHDELSTVIEEASAAYSIDAEVHLPSERAGQAEIRGELTMTYTNTTGEPIAELPFRLYANGPDEQGDALSVDDVTLDGVSVEPEWNDGRTTVAVVPDTELVPGSSVVIAMTFVTEVPVDEREHYGIFNIDPDGGTWALAHWYPILAGWDPDRGWVLDPPSQNGDPIFSTTASYELTLRAPSEWRVVSTGVEVGSSETGSATERHIVTGPARDLTVVLDNDFERVEREVEGTTIISWFNPGDDRVGEAVLEYTAQSLAYFNELIGSYPYTTLDVVPTDLFGAAGVEFPQLIYIGSSYYSPNRDLSVPNGLDFTVAHEVLHQWWYGMVGNNQYDHAFIDEGLTNFMSSTLYFDEVYGPQASEIMTERYLEARFSTRIASGDDQIVNTPTDDFSSGSAYVFAAYVKAPMGFKAIHNEIGHDAFAEATQLYYAENRFTVASPDDLLAAFEEASGQELDDLWNHWFEQSAGEEDV